MAGSHGTRLLTLVFCLGMAAAVGCAGSGGSLPAPSLPFGGKTTDVVPGIPSPVERITLLRSLRERPATANPNELERVSQELADLYRREEDPAIRAEIVRTLSVYPTESAASVLRAALDDSSADVRIAACKVWGMRKDEEAVNLLSERLGSDGNVDVRLAAAEALGETGQRSATAALGEALEDRDPAMQYRAVASLRRVSDQDFGNDVNRWRQYVKGDLPASEKPVSVAEQFRRMF